MEGATLFSGGALLVGDLARPDLLGGGEETRRNASLFCETLHSKILSPRDLVEVYPTHVSGSLCSPAACRLGLSGPVHAARNSSGAPWTSRPR